MNKTINRLNEHWLKRLKTHLLRLGSHIILFYFFALIALLLLIILFFVWGRLFRYQQDQKLIERNLVKENNLPTDKPDNKAGWKTYTDITYGLSFRYPAEYGYTDYGPNLFQQQLYRGETISGTVPPAYDVVGFDSPEKVTFDLLIYHGDKDKLTPTFTYGGECGTQFADENISNQLEEINGTSFLMRVQKINNKFRLDNCFKNDLDQLITFRFDGITVDQLTNAKLIINNIEKTITLNRNNNPIPVIKDCQSFTDPKAGFSLACPPNVFLSDNTSPDYLKLSLVSRSIDTLDEPMNYNKETALKDERELSQGLFGENFDWPYIPSEKVIKIGGIYAKSFIVFRRFSTSDVSLDRILIFYRNGYQIVVTLSADPQTYIVSMPEYFGRTENISNWVWSDELVDKFYKDLIDGKAPPAALKWYKDFDKIVQTIKFL